ncbi:MAG: peptide-methionine (S)-S-oxide reductase MsrA [Bacteroidales bacterium]
MKSVRVFFLAAMLFAAGLLFGNHIEIEKVMVNEKAEVATLAGGCFWCTEAIFDRVKGVQSVVSGYSGGDVINPAYREVTSGNTGHAEAIQITFNPAIVSYIELLEIFFKTHDPTTLNRQGADVGTQYRSAIFYHSDEQRKAAEEIIAALNSENIWKNPIVTEVTEFSNFYPAEDYHQEYFDNNSNQGYCRMVIQPKVDKFEKVFRDKLKK